MDAENELDALVRHLNDGDGTLTLADVSDYLTNVRDYIQAALDDIEAKL
ncbi:hypothetical protein [Microbacterium sp.]